MQTHGSRRPVCPLFIAGCIGLAACTGVVSDGGSTTPTTPRAPGMSAAGTMNPTTPGAPAGMGSATPCTPGVPPTSQLPRLTRVQYDNTLRDLVGFAGQPSSMLAPDTFGAVDQRAWEGYRIAGDTVAKEILGNPGTRRRLVTCTPTGDGAACAKEVIESFGKKAFRRPLTANEVTRFMALYSKARSADPAVRITESGTFDQAMQVIAEAFLVSPSFLIRAELSEPAPGSGDIPLGGYEMASRLSYLLWSTMPDDELFAAAADGRLATEAGVAEQARRMLMDGRSRAMVAGFHERYMHMGDGTRWSEIAKDARLFPAFSATMIAALSEETRRFFDHIVFDKGGSLRDLLTSPTAFVNAALAPLYGLEASRYGADLVPVDLDPTQRAGVFTRVGFLAANAYADRPSPIHRGAFVQKEVLCTEIGLPEDQAAAFSTPLPASGSNRQRVDAQTSGGATCISCHIPLINPTGFAFESFDALGAWQTTERTGGAKIDTTADVRIGDASVRVNGAVDLVTKIADSPHAQACYATKWVQYAYERRLTAGDRCTVEALTAKMARSQGGYRVLDLIADLTQTPSFRYRAKELP